MHEGARGYFLWPAERAPLLDAVALTRSLVPVAADGDGQIVSVLGAGGGVGTTFVATHLADAFARAARPTTLVDGCLAAADLRCALGGEDDARSIADLVPVAAELSAAHIAGVVEQHARGFSVLHAPPVIDPSVDPRLVTAAVTVAARSGQTVVVQASREVHASALELLESSHLAIVVLTLEVRSFQAARRAVAWLGDAVPVEFLVNRAARAEVAPHDVTRVFGRSPIAIVPAERGVGAAQDRGRLLSARSRAARIFSELATRLGDRAERAA
jgi:pilus assembly protein CpaE